HGWRQSRQDPDHWRDQPQGQRRHPRSGGRHQASPLRRSFAKPLINATKRGRGEGMLYLADHAAIAAAVRAAAAVDPIGSPCGRAARAGRKALATAGINAAIATGTLVYRPSTTNVL